MNQFKISKSDIKIHLEKNKTLYIMLFLCFLIGVVAAFIVGFSKSSYLGLLNIEDKNMITTINGTISLMSNFWDYLWSFALPLLLIFLLSLNYYLSFINFVVFSYQSMLLVLTCLAMVESYSFLGFLKILLILPINLCYFLIMCYWIVVCFNRVKLAKRFKLFSSGFDNRFLVKFYICAIALLIVSILVGIVVPLILKTAIFLIF